jgi:putative ABC transport system ATP-binding protein
MDAILRTVNLTKTYRSGGVEVHALRGVDAEFERGKLTAVIGASGSGKSTLLHLLGGIDSEAEGNVLLENDDLLQMNDSRLAKMRSAKIGFVFQFFHLIPELTARENILFPFLVRGGKQEAAPVAELSQRLGIEDRLEHYPSMLSGGQQQRVAIARALVNDPDILLCDEPTGNLDSQAAKEVMALLSDLSREDAKTVIIVTHDMGIAQQCGRVIEIADGRIVGS